MSLAFYFDHHVPRAAAIGLRFRSVDVLTAYEDGSNRWGDREILDRATHLNRVLVTQDDDFLVEAATRIRKGIPFSGVIFAPQTRVSVGKLVSNLELVAGAVSQEEIENNVLYLPL
ncbi:MAG: DUF5615 family PIN-like protein [Candidatus Omnitrophica bacterium]|nr:DUF5615 family PIN-like protein [Candidatus Omnitrophota bacterium]MCA9415853.1 DUF5615 family PIN-like protein [Candidatus Omnitrophota bacterium]MCA9423828.1 DUF5615 family PIN-like protein [Candidatus Omnitrophota bacterium]MCA9434197.1 DUF5615 family PIN-like protein [Candidatus Omnitrophota bacterium]MCA9445496.1 DUF5615 family PIN-like protein [Candidatus Omnitrophota bacterium]